MCWHLCKHSSRLLFFVMKFPLWTLPLLASSLFPAAPCSSSSTGLSLFSLLFSLSGLFRLDPINCCHLFKKLLMNLCLMPVQVINATFPGLFGFHKNKKTKPNHTADIYNTCIAARQQLSCSCSFSWAATSSFAHHWVLLMLCSNFLFNSHVNTEL